MSSNRVQKGVWLLGYISTNFKSGGLLFVYQMLTSEEVQEIEVDLNRFKTNPRAGTRWHATRLLKQMGYWSETDFDNESGKEIPAPLTADNIAGLRNSMLTQLAMIIRGEWVGDEIPADAVDTIPGYTLAMDWIRRNSANGSAEEALKGNS